MTEEAGAPRRLAVPEQHRIDDQRDQRQADGQRRESDNWQKGMSKASYAKGLKRHVLHFWLRHRGFEPNDPKAAPNIVEDLCAIMFNAQGYLYEILKEKEDRNED